MTANVTIRNGDRVMEKLVEHRSVTTQIDHLEAELKTMVEKIGTLQVGMTSPDDKFAILTCATESLKAAATARGEKTADWARQIEALSGGRIKAELHIDGE